MTLKQRIKELWSRYKAWQLDPMHHQTHNGDNDTLDDRHCCANCHREFTSQFCPDCGQKAGVGRITWRSIGEGVMDLWGLGTRSLPYTLWQLIWRPGYLIGDYITGRRQMSFPPIKMLFFVAVFAFLFMNWIEPSGTTDDTIKHTHSVNFDSFIEMVDGLFSRRYDISALSISSFCILPTYLIFRHAPRCGHHTLPEGFFIQVFIAVMVLMWVILLSIAGPLYGENEIIDNLFGALLALIVYRTYHQLFGYGHWGTAWRFVLMLASTALLALVVYLMAYLVFLAIEGQWSYAVSRFAKRFLPFVGSFAAILAIVHYFNVWSTNKTNNEQSEDYSDASDGASRPDGTV